MTRFSRFYVKSQDQKQDDNVDPELSKFFFILSFYNKTSNYISLFLEDVENSSPEKETPSSFHSCLKTCCPFCVGFIERRREKLALDLATKRYVIKQD